MSDQRKLPVPNEDQVSRLLGSITETYSWKDFKPILTDPERLKKWLVEKMPTDPETYLSPDDPAKEEQATMSAEAEHEMLMFWQELTPEEQEMLEKAFRELWGKAGTRLLPVSMR